MGALLAICNWDVCFPSASHDLAWCTVSMSSSGMGCALPAALYHAASPVSRTYLISFALERGLLRDDNDCRGCCGSSVLLCEGFKRDSAIECDSGVSSSQLARLDNRRSIVSMRRSLCNCLRPPVLCFCLLKRRISSCYD